MNGVYTLPANEDGEITFSRVFAFLEPYKYGRDRDYILVEEFWTAWEHDGITYRIRVPKGFVTDVASVPRWAWSFSGITPDGLHRNAAVIHDVGYMWQGKFPPGWFQKLEDMKWVNVEATWSREEIDKLFLRIMKACGVPPKTRALMFWAVRVGAWFAWLGVDRSRERWRNAFK